MWLVFSMVYKFHDEMEKAQSSQKVDEFYQVQIRKAKLNSKMKYLNPAYIFSSCPKNEDMKRLCQVHVLDFKTLETLRHNLGLGISTR